MAQKWLLSTSAVKNNKERDLDNEPGRENVSAERQAQQGMHACTGEEKEWLLQGEQGA